MGMESLKKTLPVYKLTDTGWSDFVGYMAKENISCKEQTDHKQGAPGLYFSRDGLEFRADASAWLSRVDFTSSNITHMRRKTLGKRQPLFKAVGINNDIRSVLDMTAGFLGDAFKLACLNMNVLAYEKSLEVYALAQDGLRRGYLWSEENGDAELREVLSRIQLHYGDARAVSIPGHIQCIYIDPMFPEKKKGALSGKHMQAIQSLSPHANIEENRQLLEFALQHNIGRVVVKRPLKQSPLVSGVNHSFEGKSICYDLYVSN